MLDATDGVELTTPPAAALLELLIDDDPAHREIPAPTFTLAADVRHRGREGLIAPPFNEPTSLGRLTLHGSLPDDATDCRDALPLRAVFGLTPRKRENATLVARRLDMAALAEPLAISPWTVQDHLKQASPKTDTRSQRELLAQVFFHDQLPGIAAHEPLSAGGHLQPSDAPGAHP